jgi:hypothetical protein
MLKYLHSLYSTPHYSSSTSALHPIAAQGQERNRVCLLIVHLAVQSPFQVLAALYDLMCLTFNFINIFETAITTRVILFPAFPPYP